VDLAVKWAVLPHCGGSVTFCGTVRDHSEGHPGVTYLEYEAYLEQVVPRLTEVATTARSRWPDIGRLVLLHRIGRLEVGEVSVVVVTSTPHRAGAFASAQYCIDTLKQTVPIWKRETWAGGSDWTVCTNETADPGHRSGAHSARSLAPSPARASND
jgi:molybdopterin synthase catalytic subunit